MIKNQRQYGVTREQLKLLSTALEEARAAAAPDVFLKAHIMSLETDIGALKEELREYDSLSAGAFDPAPLEAIPHLGQDLIRARIACNLSHKKLAQALGKQEQAIQRLEATEYASASLATLEAIARVIMSFRGEAGSVEPLSR